MSERKKSTLLTRREAIARVSAMLGGATLVGQAAMLSGCGETRDAEPEPSATEAPPAALFSNADIGLLDEIAETILPETDTPGARAAGVGPFMALMVTDTYYPPEQAVFTQGLADIDARCQAMHGSTFLGATAAQRLALLQALDREQFDQMRARSGDAPPHYFRMMKELALLGYFTSEIGYTQAMRYSETPGRYEPCVPYTPGEPAWARHA